MAEYDKGILAIINFDWSLMKIQLSQRDNSHPAIQSFDSPFIHENISNRWYWLYWVSFY